MLRKCGHVTVVGLCAVLVVAAGFFLAIAGEVRAADPVKVGFSIALTGGIAPIGKQLLAAVEFWRDDVNAKGGLLGRPVQLVLYDDQSTPSNVPGIYTKLLSVDKVDLLLGPYATNMVAAAMPVIMQSNKMTIALLAIGINRHFQYPRYFTTAPVGPDGVKAMTRGFFELAAAQKPRPQTVAIVAADAEFAKTSADGARANVEELGFKIVADKSYPPGTTDLLPIIRSVQSSNPDVVFVAAYPPDTVGIVRAANEIGFAPKMFGGTMTGLFVTPIKVQLGPLLNGLVIMESFVPAPSFSFPGLDGVIARYQSRAKADKIDPLGYSNVPFGYAAGQILAKAVEETKSLDHDKLAQYLRTHTFATVAGEIAFGKDGEWAQARTLYTQFQKVAPNDMDQFRSVVHEPILWPDKYKTGTIVYPYAEARK